MTVRITPRRVLGTGAGVLTLGCALRSVSLAPARRQPELFVFRSPDESKLVCAVVVPAACSTHFDVRIHAGPKSWTVGGVRAVVPGAVTKCNDGAVFAGEVLGHSRAAAPRSTAVVIEGRPDLVRPGESLDVWAELRVKDGSRLRVGSPFVAALLAVDPAMSQRYHAASPAEDRGLFTEALAGRISAAAIGGGVADPGLHARRLVICLLPDVIRYRPDLPVGFSFASQNGRHPADDAMAVVETVLTGAVAPRAKSNRVRLTGGFPYFPQPIAAA